MFAIVTFPDDDEPIPITNASLVVAVTVMLPFPDNEPIIFGVTVPTLAFPDCIEIPENTPGTDAEPLLVNNEKFAIVFPSIALTNPVAAEEMLIPLNLLVTLPSWVQAVPPAFTVEPPIKLFEIINPSAVDELIRIPL